MKPYKNTGTAVEGPGVFIIVADSDWREWITRVANDAFVAGGSASLDAARAVIERLIAGAKHSLMCGFGAGCDACNQLRLDIASAESQAERKNNG